jgi:hypothetical protein
VDTMTQKSQIRRILQTPAVQLPAHLRMKSVRNGSNKLEIY